MKLVDNSTTLFYITINLTEEQRDPLYDGHWYKVSKGSWKAEDLYGTENYFINPAPVKYTEGENPVAIGLGSIWIDGKHSYEDKIVPVEQAYNMLHNRIAILGGIDVDFLSRSTPAQVYERCHNMIQISKISGGYALGSGNSIPDYISNENYLALLKAANEEY